MVLEIILKLIHFKIVDFDLKWIDFYIYQRNPILGNLRMFQPADFLNPYPWILEKIGHGPKKWHLFLFSTASFYTYWHMPFEIGIIR